MAFIYLTATSLDGYLAPAAASPPSHVDHFACESVSFSGPYTTKVVLMEDDAGLRGRRGLRGAEPH